MIDSVRFGRSSKSELRPKPASQCSQWRFGVDPLPFRESDPINEIGEVSRQPLEVAGIFRDHGPARPSKKLSTTGLPPQPSFRGIVINHCARSGSSAMSPGPNIQSRISAAFQQRLHHRTVNCLQRGPRPAMLDTHLEDTIAKLLPVPSRRRLYYWTNYLHR